MTMATAAVNRESQEDAHLPGDFAIWIFIGAELLVFGVLFAVYAWTRRHHLELFNLHQLELDRTSGLINTMALLTSSYLVVRAVKAMGRGDAKACTNWLIVSLAFGGVFVVVKLTEYAAHFDHGMTLSGNIFYMFYISLTFFHFMHVLMGMVILSAVAFKAHRGGYSREEHTGVHTGASYWHMVDLVWLILFPLVYVMR